MCRSCRVKNNRVTHLPLTASMTHFIYCWWYFFVLLDSYHQDFSYDTSSIIIEASVSLFSLSFISSLFIIIYASSFEYFLKIWVFQSSQGLLFLKFFFKLCYFTSFVFFLKILISKNSLMQSDSRGIRLPLEFWVSSFI